MTTTATSVLSQEMTLGPLSGLERATILTHARPLSPAGKRLFRRLLILAQPLGLSEDIIAKAARRAQEHTF